MGGGVVRHAALMLKDKFMDTTMARTFFGLNFSQIARIVFFDTYNDIGVFTEVIGVTEEGDRLFEK